MNFAVLGDAPEILPLLRAICQSRDHAINAFWRAEGLRDWMQQHGGGVTEAASIKELKHDSSIAAVIVSGSDAELMDAARELAEAGKSVLVLPQQRQDLGVIYELSLVTADKPITLFPIFPLRVHPLVAKLRQLLDEGQLGVVQYLELNRSLAPDSQLDQAPLLTKDKADAAFLADVDLLRDLGGNYSQVTTLRTGKDEALSAITTTLGSEQAPQANWTAKAGGENSWRLTIAGMRSTAVLTGEPANGALTLEVDGPDLSLPTESVTEDWGQAMLEAYLGAADHGPGQPTWEDLQRGMELMHATARSLRRKRTIELFFEAHSERSNFKTQMTAIGCGLILFTLFAMILVLVGGQAGLPAGLMKILRIAIFAPLGIFLLLQVLLVLTKPAKNASHDVT